MVSHGISLQVTVHIDPKDTTEFFQHFKPLYDQVVAEPELRFFEVYQSAEVPGTISWVEHWDCTKEWLFKVQLNKQYFKDYQAKADHLLLKPRDAIVVNRVGPPYSVWKDKSTPEKGPGSCIGASVRSECMDKGGW
ncbi:hypothetical protein B0T14DRAFT_439461 [Immersiella caudata]|uniref:ABM domain-containing protein n=1 Tax=Immersiella caudata TaxID=314043 RepID=A0AA39WCQ0_9PEZI|nr:hypothetical protein B0T14DRAFT_439461 [Immersiella caudata]